ncbi:MAG: hypothetical protein K0R05_4122, partial [Anaerocolumna sp.]|nr:hypothetical protein [Anaerocolumna sp.]
YDIKTEEDKLEISIRKGNDSIFS